uniref:Secreted protein n=1 Tax=Homo sapiens TaxID=9606 RepID=Q8WYY3_HUMAN|nr:unknown [Homo sapiens]
MPGRAFNILQMSFLVCYLGSLLSGALVLLVSPPPPPPQLACSIPVPVGSCLSVRTGGSWWRWSQAQGGWGHPHSARPPSTSPLYPTRPTNVPPAPPSPGPKACFYGLCTTL